MWIKKEPPKCLRVSFDTIYTSGVNRPPLLRVSARRCHAGSLTRCRASGRGEVFGANGSGSLFGRLHARHVLPADRTGEARPLAPVDRVAVVERAGVVVGAGGVVLGRHLARTVPALLRRAAVLVGHAAGPVRERRVRDARHRIARVRRAGVAVVDDRRSAFDARSAGRRTGLHTVADVAVRTVLRRAPRTGASLTRVAFRTRVAVVA